MKLTTRLSVFFLGVLAVVLLGFSVTLYLLARTHLYAELDDHLSTALHTLVAASEAEETGLEWDIRERRLSLGHGATRDHLRWKVSDDQGQFLDGSPNAVSDPVLAQAPALRVVGLEPKQTIRHDGQAWWLLQRRLQAGTAVPTSASKPRPPIEPDDTPKYAGLVMTVAVSLAPVEQTLRLLGWVSAGLSVGLWLALATVARSVCRRALLPAIQMAEATRAMDAGDLDQRLPSPGTRDEIDDISRAFNALLDRRQESFERQQRFTGDASHQLRTPLTAILGQIEVALRRARTPEEYEQVLRSLQRQGEQLRQIVEMLLFLARAESEARLPNLETVPVSQWLHEHMKSWASHERLADLKVECPLDDSLWVVAQPPLLGQMIDNLLDNAFKYSEPGSPVTLRVQADDEFISLTIEDAGTGIRPEDLPHIFEPFYRSSEARRLGCAGAGLGLAVAQRIATAFGGIIRVQQTEGRGTRFTVILKQAACKLAGPSPHEQSGETETNDRASLVGQVVAESERMQVGPSTSLER